MLDEPAPALSGQSTRLLPGKSLSVKLESGETSYFHYDVPASSADMDGRGLDHPTMTLRLKRRATFCLEPGQQPARTRRRGAIAPQPH